MGKCAMPAILTNLVHFAGTGHGKRWRCRLFMLVASESDIRGGWRSLHAWRIPSIATATPSELWAKLRWRDGIAGHSRLSARKKTDAWHRRAPSILSKAVHIDGAQRVGAEMAPCRVAVPVGLTGLAACRSGATGRSCSGPGRCDMRAPGRVRLWRMCCCNANKEKGNA